MLTCFLTYDAMRKIVIVSYMKLTFYNFITKLCTTQRKIAEEDYVD